MERKHHAVSEHTLLEWASRLGHGVQAMHDNKYIHCDITPRNIFRSSAKLEHIKIGDMGLATQMGKTGPLALSSIKGPSTTSAPEGKFSTASDIWSIGCILFMAMRPDFDPEKDSIGSKAQRDIHEMIDNTNLYSARWKGLVKQMLTWNPEERIKCDALLNEVQEITQSMPSQ